MNESEYTKKGGRRELSPPLSKEAEISQSTSFPIELNTPKDYIKVDGDFDPSLFVIISGGEVREKNYFASFKLKNRKNNSSLFPRIKIEFICQNERGVGGFNVNQLVNQGINVKAKYDESKSDDINDNIYLVTDVDDFRDQLINRKEDCKKNNLKLIISNPCIEIWLYYSYFKEKPEDFEVPKNSSKISEMFKTYVGSKKKGGIDPRKAPFEIANGINNSKNLYSFDDEGIPHLFSTNMFELAEKIFPLVNVEIESEKERRVIKANSYKKMKD